MTYRKCSLMKRTLLMLAMLALAACNTPARIPAPDSDTVDSGKRALEELARLPPAMVWGGGSFGAGERVASDGWKPDVARV